MGSREEIEEKVWKHGTERLKRGFPRMQKGGVIMDVVNVEQARIAEDAGAVAVMALERIPYDVRKEGGVARTAAVERIQEIMDMLTIPVTAKARIGHYGEVRMLEAIGVDMIDESEVLTPADELHIDKRQFTIPFVCGARNLGEALRRIDEGAAMIRTKGEPGTGDVREAVRHFRIIRKELATLKGLNDLGYKDELIELAKEYRVPRELVYETAEKGKLPVVNFAAGGIATPADAAYMMELGADGVFVGSGIFKSEEPEEYAKAIVQAVADWDKPEKIAEYSKGLKSAMKGYDSSKLEDKDKMQIRSK
ncbi:MAG: pyridoxal 5'-phosphate synthase lyase subunit PdxS [Candidatus Thorarchaeota archaeon]